MYVCSSLLLPWRSVDLIEKSQRLQNLYKPSSSPRKRKRGQEEQEAQYQKNQDGRNQDNPEELEGGNQAIQAAEYQEEQGGGNQEEQEAGYQEEQEGENQVGQESENQEEREGGDQKEQEVLNQEEQDVGYISPRTREKSPFKRPSISPPGCATATVPGKKEETWDKKRPSDLPVVITDPIQYWALTKRWPKEFFESQGQTWEDLESQGETWEDSEKDDSPEEQMEKSMWPTQWFWFQGFRLPCPVRKVPTLRRKHSGSSLSESCDQTNREKKSVPYTHPQYAVLLEAKGSYMYESDLGITKESKDLNQLLLQPQHAVPNDSLFRDDIFEKTCRKIEGRNEAKVIQDIARLIVPSVECLATYGATHLEHLIEGVNEAWLGNIPIEGPRPQPDYFVGFRRSAFTKEQLKKIDPLIGSGFETSFYIANYRTYFPFFTCEVKCGAAALDVGDRQNAHSMTVAIRALTVLFQSVGREKELNRKILTFSISHDHRTVRIYGHYLIVENDEINSYRHLIHAFDFRVLDGKEKWTTYQFTRNLYDLYAPIILKLICSAIDDLPAGISFDLSQRASFSSDVGSVQGNDETESSFSTSQKATTPTTSFSQATATEPASKKPKNQ